MPVSADYSTRVGHRFRASLSGAAFTSLSKSGKARVVSHIGSRKAVQAELATTGMSSPCARCQVFLGSPKWCLGNLRFLSNHVLRPEQVCGWLPIMRFNRGVLGPVARRLPESSSGASFGLDCPTQKLAPLGFACFQSSSVCAWGSLVRRLCLATQGKTMWSCRGAAEQSAV